VPIQLGLCGTRGHVPVVGRITRVPGPVVGVLKLEKVRRWQDDVMRKCRKGLQVAGLGALFQICVG